MVLAVVERVHHTGVTGTVQAQQALQLRGTELLGGRKVGEDEQAHLGLAVRVAAQGTQLRRHARGVAAQCRGRATRGGQRMAPGLAPPDLHTLDRVQEVIEALIKKLEEGLALKEMPSALTADIVTKRLVPAIVEDDNRSVLSRLSEVNYYYAKGYIDENAKSDAFEKIASKNGLALATGTKKEKTEAIEKLLDDELK